MTEEVRITVASGELSGSLLVPQASPPVTVVLMIAGSGPTDRDGNSEKLRRGNNSMRMLAEGLAAGGIASLRYDKRGVGQSRAARGTASQTRFEDFVRDAEAWMAMLKGDPRFDAVCVAGHSEGSLVGMIAARNTGADGFVSIAGAGRPIDQVITEQLARQPKFLRTASERILAALRRGETVEKVNPLLASLYKPELQPFLSSWMAYDPSQEIAGLRIPILIVQGGRDLQATENDFDALRRARPDAAVLRLETMNHVLKECAPGLRKNLATYSRPDLPLAGGLIGAIVEFAQKIRTSRSPQATR